MFINTENDFLLEDLESAKRAVDSWQKNEGNIRKHYPFGLSQYLGEKNYGKTVYTDLIESLVKIGVTPLLFQEMTPPKKTIWQRVVQILARLKP